MLAPKYTRGLTKSREKSKVRALGYLSQAVLNLYFRYCEAQVVLW
jgi:hypothetical protein